MDELNQPDYTGEYFRIKIPLIQNRISSGDWGVPQSIFSFKDLTDNYRYQSWRLWAKGEIDSWKKND